MAQTYTRITLAERPKADFTSTTFKTDTNAPLAELKPGENQVLVQVEWVSLDPAMRGWVNDKRSYIPPVQIGEIMRAGGIGIVLEAGPGSRFKKGDAVKGLLGWTEYAVLNDKDVTLAPVPPGLQLVDHLGPLGIIGMTAYFGVTEVGKIKAGETLVVSGAAGATGSVVCQIGKIKGAKVIAIAGSEAKCQMLEKEIGVDKALNYKSPNFKQEFEEAVGYLDVYFDNVGGDILNLALSRMKVNARIVMCGAISDYNNPNPKGLTAYMNIITMRATLQGFIVFDFAPKFAAAGAEMIQWIHEGKLKVKYHIVEGLEKAPETLPLLYNGGNTGKLLIKVGKEPSKL